MRSEIRNRFKHIYNGVQALEFDQEGEKLGDSFSKLRLRCPYRRLHGTEKITFAGQALHGDSTSLRFFTVPGMSVVFLIFPDSDGPSDFIFQEGKTVD